MVLSLINKPNYSLPQSANTMAVATEEAEVLDELQREVLAERLEAEWLAKVQ
jgi:hypothetical protein